MVNPARWFPSHAATRGHGMAGPIEKYIVPLNAALCFIIALKAWSASRGKRTSSQPPEDLVGYLIPLSKFYLDQRLVSPMDQRADLPAVIFILILIARSQLKPVDVEGLDRLRYRYKGA